MKATTTQGREIDLKQEAVDDSEDRVSGGRCCSPGDAGYEESRTVWNAMIDRRPAVVARCLGIADVIACVQFARENDLLLCIKGGGHNIAGLATADGALMLDMSLMRGVWVDPQRKVAHAQAGCLLGDVDRETQVHGLAAVLGFVSLTGIAGLTLGGGFGYLTRRWGWTSDNVVGMDVVTADARLVRASSDENADLFWGLRGGGGNFGVVTGIDYTLYPGRSRDRRRRRRLAGERGARGARAVPDARRAGPARTHARRAHAPGAAGAVAAEGDAREADRGAARLPQREARGGREGRRPHQVVRQADRRRARAPAVRADAVAARRHAAEGPALLLEERVPAAHRAGPVREGHRARGKDPRRLTRP